MTGPRAALFRSAGLLAGWTAGFQPARTPPGAGRQDGGGPAGRDAGAPRSAPKPTVSSMRAMGITLLPGDDRMAGTFRPAAGRNRHCAHPQSFQTPIDPIWPQHAGYGALCVVRPHLPRLRCAFHCRSKNAVLFMTVMRMIINCRLGASIHRPHAQPVAKSATLGSGDARPAPEDSSSDRSAIFIEDDLRSGMVARILHLTGFTD